MIDKIKALLQEVENMTAANAEELEALRIKYLSKKGEISALMNDFRNVPAEQKREVGIYINQLKETAQNKINELKESFENTQTFNNEIDLTRTAYPINLGTRHPLSLVKKEICDIFASFLPINDEFSSGMSLRDLNKDNLASFFTSVQENAYRTTLFGKTEEGVFNGVFVNLVNGLKSAYQSEIEQSTTLQEMLSEDNYPNIDFVQVFELLSSLEESIG